MGHDVSIINVKTKSVIGHTYISGNFSKYKDDYPGIHSIHGHKNSTVIKIIRGTLDKLLDNDVVPFAHNKESEKRCGLTFGDKDPQKDLECYAACLQEFLGAAVSIKRRFKNGLENGDIDDIYWYSDQVFNITKHAHYDSDNDLYESDGLENNSF